MIKIKKYLILFIFIIFNNYTINPTPITIFVHGTRGLSKLLFKYCHVDNKIVNIYEIPSTYVTCNIAKTLAFYDPVNFAAENFYVFGWSGKLNSKSRLEASHALYNEILQLTNQLNKKNISPKINLITHSHGGNVALNLAHHYRHKHIQINNLILLACPIQEHTSHLINHNIFNRVYNIYSHSDLLQVMDPQGLHTVNKDKEVPFFSQRIFKPCAKLKQVHIEKIAHAGFLSPYFYEHFPLLLKTIEESKQDHLYLSLKNSTDTYPKIYTR